ncbi:MAG: GTP-binding protein [Oscillospiraceae bacterium]|nr:GTP-binding protein [Oscillospiraceae bacterium]
MIQVDIISGFLGAGKTTFANMLLKHYMRSGARPVFIVNEFGQTGLDAEIIKAEGFEAVELEGGCICCTLKGQVSVAMLSVVEAFSPTHIVFEPSGIFIFDDFFDVLKEEGVRGKCELGNALTIVDGVNFSYTKAMYGSFLYNQIKNAAVLILSKLEKTQHDPDELIADLRNINPDSFIMAKKWQELRDEDFELLLSERKGMYFDHPEHLHSHFQTVTLKPRNPFSQERVNKLADLCVSGAFGDVFRAKGILTVDSRATLLNIARGDVTIETFKGYSEETLTLIGNKINKKAVKAFLLE